VQVAQVVAKELGISMDLIKLKASTALTSPNNSTTGGSMGSEMNCYVSGPF
jgi:xanthine dehydrogenase molybdopterin-binding subunit B